MFYTCTDRWRNENHLESPDSLASGGSLRSSSLATLVPAVLTSPAVDRRETATRPNGERSDPTWVGLEPPGAFEVVSINLP
ncbi:MAG: hypothetical protein J07HN6_00879 [Halonotius sp. J07HN6]|nr:MAG: hypothetical protein J07HN6_00879 [Halonotius sp. J07HN6]